MYGLKRGQKAEIEKKANVAQPGFGLMRGPGTGTSDSIPAKIPPGSYIMPADSTEQIGADTLAQMGARGLPKRPAKPSPDDAPKLGLPGWRKDVPVRLSNGEFGMPPDQVHAIGAEVLDQARMATHTPAPRLGLRRPQQGAQVPAPGLGLKWSKPNAQEVVPAPRLGLRRPDDKALYFANGGLVDDDERARTVQGAPGLGFPPRSQPLPKSTPGGQSGYGLAGLQERNAPQPTAGAQEPKARGLPGYQPPAAPASARPQISAPEQPRVGGLSRTPTMGETMNRINDQRAQRTGGGLYGTTRTETQTNAAYGLPGYQDRVNAIPGPSPAQLAASDRLSNPGQTTPTAPAVGGLKRPEVSDAYPDESARGLPGYRARGISPTSPQATQQRDVQGAPGVQRFDNVGGLKSPLYTNLPGAQAIGQMQGGGVSTIGSESAQQLSERADRMAALREQNTALRDGLNFNAGGALSRQKTQGEIERGLLTGASRSGRQVAAGLIRDRSEAGAQVARLGLDRQRFGLDQQRLGIDQQRAETESRTQGFGLRGLERIEGLQQQFEAETDPGKRAQLAERLRVLTGRERDTAGLEKARMDLVGNLYKSYAELKAFDKDNKMPAFDQWAAPALGLAGASQHPGSGQGLQSASRPAGTVSKVGNKTAVWDGSRWVEQS